MLQSSGSGGVAAAGARVGGWVYECLAKGFNGRLLSLLWCEKRKGTSGGGYFSN